MPSLALAFGALLAGGVIVDKGVQHMRVVAKGGAVGSSNTQLALPPLANNSTVAGAAMKWQVPQGILWGVYGNETGYGSNTSNSSAGALGPFQFLPSTAQRYGLSGTTVHQLGPSADAAAHYLHDLYKQYGSWDAALRHYSGGGYGLSEVEAKAQGLPTS